MVEVLIKELLGEFFYGEGFFDRVEGEVIGFVSDFSKPLCGGAAGLVGANEEREAFGGCRTGTELASFQIDDSLACSVGDTPVQGVFLMKDSDDGVGLDFIDKLGNKAAEGDAVAGE